MKRWTALVAIAAMTSLFACGSAAQGAAPIEGRGIAALTAGGLEGLTALASFTSRPDIENIEVLLGAKAALVLDTGVYLEYKILGPEHAWFATARLLVSKEDGREWLQTIEVKPRSPCIPESALASMWVQRAGIPIEKLWDTRDTSKGWVRRNIPHMIGAISWVHTPPGRTISYFLRGVGQDACASGFSFSFSR